MLPTKSTAEPQTEVMTPQDQAIGAVQRWGWVWRDRVGWSRPQFWLAAGVSALAGTLVGVNPGWVQQGERGVQSLFWRAQLNAAPENIVILGVDEATQVRLSRWPLPRATYAQVIDRVMQAGAKGVAIDILFDNPSSLGAIDPNVDPEDCDVVKPSKDDLALRDAIARYPGKITLPTAFVGMDDQSLSQQRLLLPFCPLQQVQVRLGNIDFLPESNGAIARLGEDFLQSLSQKNQVYQRQIQEYAIQSFAAAALQSAQMKYQQRQSGDIYFYGSRRTFPTFSLVDVVQPENWKSRFQNGAYFRDKLVLIGPTDETLGDIKDTASGKMPGVELHANAIATLMQDRALRPVLPYAWAIGGGVALLLLCTSLLQARGDKSQWRLLWTLGLMLGWMGASYGLMTQASLLLPTMVPLGALGFVGAAYAGLDGAKAKRNRQELEKSLLDRARNPVIKDILAEQRDRRLEEQVETVQQELLGTKIGARYEILGIHGAGGFGETYIAKDTQRPGQPKCVVKKLSPVSSNPKHLKLAKRLFDREADALEQLGKSHDQIPQLLAHFEEAGQFYLVQEFIAGHPLSSEIALGRQLPETKVIAVLREILNVLGFVHKQGVIHRDVKPSNLIRRDRDNRLVLIDFGAVKGVQTVGDDEIVSDLTIGIGTQGYMAPEQQAGHPQFSSDIYALGMMAVQMLTGISPSQLTRDTETGEVDWQSKTHASVGLIEVVSKMICYHYKQRYQSTLEVLEDLKRLSYYSSIPDILNELIQESAMGDEDLQDTRPWPTQFDDPEGEDLPPTEPPPTV
jgi:serine/threonine protein kinase/CHASE2 domain-containing sensor protein